jgi:hypothetical protein
VRPPSTTRCAALLATLALALSACGGSGDDSQQTVTVTAPSGDQAAYVAEADALCARIASRDPELAEGAEELRKLAPSDPRFHEKAAAHFARVLDVATSGRDEFDSIEPPEVVKARVSEFGRVNDDAIASLREIVSALERGTTPEEELTEYGRLLSEASGIAEAIGFEICGRI